MNRFFYALTIYIQRFDMNILLKRVFKGTDYTIGKVYIDGVLFCNSLEDTCRIVNGDCSKKIYGKTAIPEGQYSIEIIWWSKHKGFYPHLLDVPCFDGILIHGGNTAEDTLGCILLGKNTIKGQLTDSRTCFNTFMMKIDKVKNLKITIE
jgi:hypothetical protein